MDDELVSLLVEARRYIGELDARLGRAIAKASERGHGAFPNVNPLARGPIDLGDELPPICATGQCNDD